MIYDVVVDGEIKSFTYVRDENGVRQHIDVKRTEAQRSETVGKLPISGLIDQGGLLEIDQWGPGSGARSTNRAASATKRLICYRVLFDNMNICNPGVCTQPPSLQEIETLFISGPSRLPTFSRLHHGETLFLPVVQRNGLPSLFQPVRRPRTLDWCPSACCKGAISRPISIPFSTRAIIDWGFSRVTQPVLGVSRVI